MTDSQYLTNAVDFIVEREQDNDYICERLHEIPKEFEICAKTAQYVYGGISYDSKPTR